MKRATRSTPAARPVPDPFQQQRHEGRFTLLLSALSIAALMFYDAKQQLLLYGDAVAHINIARRVVDNRHPLLALQYLGTVWLPLQHIAMLPFVWNDALWRSGAAGAIPGMIAYVLGTLAIFRLVSARTTKVAGYVAAAIYALNPNLLYLQTTAMNEPIFLAFFLWTLVYLDEFLRSTTALPPEVKPRRALEACGIVLAGAAFTRYDGWFIAPIVLIIVIVIFTRWWKQTADTRQRRAMTKSLIEVLLLNALVPVFWLIHTRSVSGYALDFATGPYSAKAIALRSGTLHYPGQNHPFTAALYFLKSARLNVGAGLWAELLFALTLAGAAFAIWRFRKYGIFLLLWLPVAFYTLSIAYGSVPIYIPVWYPFSYYNVRYGLELLPAFCVFPAILMAVIAEQISNTRLKIAIGVALIALVAGSYLSIYRESPITLREAQANSRGRIWLERALANSLGELPPSATLLMYEAEHVGALEQAGIPLRHVVSEAEHPDWEWALLDPAKHADYMVACEGDPVWAAVREHRADVMEVVSIAAPGQSRCTVYKRKDSASATSESLPV